MKLSRLICGMVGVLLIAGCSTDQSPQHVNTDKVPIKALQHSKVLPQVKMDLVRNDLDYLTQLGLMRGHLYIGYELYKEGYVQHAKTHMKHPESELYLALVPAFKARHVEGFSAQLKALADAVNQNRPIKEVSQAYRNLTIAISKAEQGVQDPDQSAYDKLRLAAALLKVSGEEYGLAIDNGKLESIHEYQDSLGFAVVAGDVVESIQGHAEIKREASDILRKLSRLWPSLIPSSALPYGSDEIYDAMDKLKQLVHPST